jgi:phosphatidylserine/phosphatidylglycerophosphate/cardiolipin synthase-like enzyme
MSTSASGTVLDETGKGISGLSVLLEDVSRQFDIKLATATTDTGGNFSLSYAEDIATSTDPGKQSRQLRLRIKLGQRVLKEIAQNDEPASNSVARADLANQGQLLFREIQLERAESDSWWATLGTGSPSRLTHGNAIQWLVDNEEGWARVADLIKAAGTVTPPTDRGFKPGLDVMQLEIEIDKYVAVETREKPRVVLSFDPDSAKPLDATHVRDVDTADQRIERLLLDAWARGYDVRVHFPQMSMDPHGALVIGVALMGLASLFFLGGIYYIIAGAVLEAAIVLGGAYLLHILNRKFRTMFEAPQFAKWYEDAGADRGANQVRVRVLKQRSLMVTHAKMVIDRGVQAVLLGSPFEQVYFDTKAHAVFEPRRGITAAKGPIHDVSVGVRGPAVGHLQELFNSHWNLADPNDQQLPVLPTLPDPVPASALNSGEFLSSVQIVRTLDYMFNNATNGEEGVLEAYLRAIHFAERFIYVENQYFNNDLITQALIDALKANEKLVVILLLNPGPDMPLYLRWQLAAIDRIIGSFKDKAAAAERFGIFSAWSHAASDASHQNPRLVDNYLHTKTALIDNRWATVGSANLDGASLDFVQYGRAALDGDVRNTEANLVVFEEIPAQPSAVDALRRRLWSEHLGFASPTAPELDDAADKNWLQVWTQRADTKLAGLKTNRDAVSQIRILPWPDTHYDKGRPPFENRAASHVMADPYLEFLLSSSSGEPSDTLVSEYEVIGEVGPGSFAFKYPS